MFEWYHKFKDSHESEDGPCSRWPAALQNEDKMRQEQEVVHSDYNQTILSDSIDD